MVRSQIAVNATLPPGLSAFINFASQWNALFTELLNTSKTISPKPAERNDG
jgi:hypothetical protein